MIILAEVTERRSDGWTWVDTSAPARRGVVPPGRTPVALQPGVRVPIEVEWHRAGWRVQRIVGEPAGERPARDARTASGPAAGARPPVRTSGDSRRRSPTGGGVSRRAGRGPIVGDLVVASVPFTNWPGARDRGRLEKSRPCLVVAAGPDEVQVRAIYGSNSAVRREGLGRRIRDWREAGLRKPSYVAARDHFVPSADVSGTIGRLTTRDLGSLLG